MQRFFAFQSFPAVLTAVLLTACGGGGGGGSSPTYSVGGTVSGLAGPGLVLLDNGADNLPVPTSGQFMFATALTAGAAYSVTVMTQPTNQFCVVSNGSGAVGSSNVTSVSLACTALRITSGQPPPGTTGSGYAPSVYRGHRQQGFPLAATGGVAPYHWSWIAQQGSSLPPGLGLVFRSIYLIEGTPPARSAGNYNVLITVTDSNNPPGHATSAYTIAIENSPAPVIPDLPGPQGATLNQPYTFHFTAGGGLGPFVFTETGALPPGIGPLTTSGALTGTPNNTGTFPIMLQLADANGTLTAQNFTIGVFTDGFASTGSMQSARYSHTATLLATGQVLVAGGFGAGWTPLATAELFNPKTGVFTTTGSMTARAGHTATLLCDPSAPICNDPMVLVAGGDGGVPAAELFNPTSGLFAATKGSMVVTPRGGHTATLLQNGQVLLTGGIGASGTALAAAELYDPATGLFTMTGSMITARQDHTATLLANGKVLVTGGQDNNGVYLDSAELYNPSARTFTAVPVAMTTARAAHTATLLLSGMVLIAAGSTDPNNSLASAELFDSTANTFVATTSPLITSRSYHSAVLLPTGTVLIAGGVYKGLMEVPHAELFDPVSGTFTSTGGMQTARYFFTLTVLGSSGQVLAAGGTRNPTPSGVVNSAELYK